MFIDKYKVVIFDWDGTLSTSTPIARAARFMKLRYSMEHIEKNKHKYMSEPVGPTRTAEEVSALYSFLYDFYSFFTKPKLKVGALEIVADLKKMGKKVAIFSDSNRYRLYSETKKLGMHDKVDIVLSADSISKYKPNPTGLIMLAEKFKVKKEQCLYVGDMLVDVYAARFAGMDCCAIANGVDPYFILKKAQPEYLLRNISELVKK